MSLRLVFMGTPDFAVPTLSALVDAGHTVACCLTQPPRPAGRRGLELRRSPVHERAEALGIDVHTPLTLKDDAAARLIAKCEADAAIVVAYGMLLPQDILDSPRHGCFNGHASLLPRWRGAAPIQRAIMAGDDETGVSIMQMERGLDTGPVALMDTVPIHESTTAGKLHDRLATLSAKLMVDALEQLEQGTITLTPQDEAEATYARKIDKTESRIDWQGDGYRIHRQIMGLSPFPGAWFPLQENGKDVRVKVLESRFLSNREGPEGTVLDDALTIACGSGAIQCLRLQRAGSKPMAAADFLRGTPVAAGTVLP